MKHRGLIIAWAVLFLALGTAVFYAEVTYNAGRPVASAPVGGMATGDAIKPDANAVGDAEGAAVVGASPMGDGPPGRAVEQVEMTAPPPESQPAPQAETRPEPSMPTATTPAPMAVPNSQIPARIAYAAPAPADDGKPRIAIIISEIGLGNARSRQAIERLPPAVTLAVLSFADDRSDWVAAARAAGHEVLIAVPMEPKNYPRIDPGPAPLLIDRDDLENLTRFETAVRGAGPVVGVLAHKGDLFLTNAERLRPILAATQDRGMIFVDNRSTPDSAVTDLASRLDMHVLLNDRFIDAEPSADQIDRRLAELEDIARRVGKSVGIAAPYPIAIERIRAWAEGLEARGLRLAPVSALAVVPTGQ